MKCRKNIVQLKKRFWLSYYVFQNDLINKTFVLRIDCKSAKEILRKMLKTLFQNKSLLDDRVFYPVLIL